MAVSDRGEFRCLGFVSGAHCALLVFARSETTGLYIGIGAPGHSRFESMLPHESLKDSMGFEVPLPSSSSLIVCTDMLLMLDSESDISDGCRCLLCVRTRSHGVATTVVLRGSTLALVDIGLMETDDTEL
jgi:hypothetical protein